ncbi:MAG: RHS repeat-associated core domain-containing protein [Puniceicoccaceae bacterium]|nr:MAG: RHS repeat-associated core domain-containing protein [Puniceicoccaceae bacterium]
MPPAVKETSPAKAPKVSQPVGCAASGGVGGLLMGADDADKEFFAYGDANGNVMGRVDADTGTVTASYVYDAFGNRIRGGQDWLNPFGFSTKLHDRGSGLIYYGYRFYSPTTGRWLNRDPIGELGGLNLYGFLGNDPVNRIDLLRWTPWVGQGPGSNCI